MRFGILIAISIVCAGLLLLSGCDRKGKLIATNNWSAAYWTADSSAIFYKKITNNKPVLCRYNVANDTVTTYANYTFAPRFAISPDNSMVAYASRSGDVMCFSLSTGKSSRLFSFPATSQYQYIFPVAWSAQSAVLFVMQYPGYTYQIGLLHLDTRILEQLPVSVPDPITALFLPQADGSGFLYYGEHNMCHYYDIVNKTDQLLTVFNKDNRYMPFMLHGNKILFMQPQSQMSAYDLQTKAISAPVPFDRKLLSGAVSPDGSHFAYIESTGFGDFYNQHPNRLYLLTIPPGILSEE